MAPAMTRLTSPVGTHLPVGKGLVRGALAHAVRIEAEAVQVFLGNPRGWALSQGDKAEDVAFADGCRQAGMPVFVHTPYLVNLGSPTPTTYQRSVESVVHNLARGVRVGAEGVVVHTGSCVGEGGYDDALRQVREALLPVLDVLDDASPWLLLEPTAGQGRSLCATVADLEPYLEALEHHPKVGICLDTCHAFAAGEPLERPGGAADTVDRVIALTGPDRLRLVHANDSKDPRGSMRDRHEKIGQGHIGEQAFAELLAHPALQRVPFVLETPGSRQVDDPDIPLLKRLRTTAGSDR